MPPEPADLGAQSLRPGPLSARPSRRYTVAPMLRPEQVIPFLEHDDEEVRLHAVLFLAGAHDPSPATADDLWRAADKLGPEKADALVGRLELLPQTDDSVSRTLSELATAEGGRQADLVRVLRSLDFPLLQRHWEAIKNAANVPADVNEHLSQRLALADEPAEPLWDRMMEQATALNGKPLTEADALAAERIIEAIARRPDLFADRAVEMLRDASVNDWREVFLADLVGELKRADTIDTLLDKLRAGDADLLWETAGEALVRIGDVAAVQRIAERFAAEDWGFRVSAAGVLGRFKHPDAEAALLRLLPDEKDPEVATFLAGSLLDLCPTDEASFEAVRQTILAGRYEPGTADLRSLLLTAGKMGGYEPPEAAAWRDEMARERARWKSGATDDGGLMRSIPTLDGGPLVEQFVPVQPAGQMFGLSDARPLPPLRPSARGAGAQRGRRNVTAGRRGATTYAPTNRAGTVRRTTKKVGRNDPCPCGSGKKFKKCCGQ